MSDEIKRKKLQDENVGTTKTGGLRLSIPLTPSPPKEWAQYLEQSVSPHFPLESTTPGFKVNRGSVEFDSSEQMLDKHLADLDARIAGTNKWYFTEYLPGVEKADKQKRAADEAQFDALTKMRDRFRGR